MIIRVMAAILLATSFTFAQDDIALCHTSSTEKFASFASNKNFVTEHQLPRVYAHASQNGGKMISLDCPDGQKANAYFIPAKKKSDLWILVFQEWWGLNDNIKRHSEDLYNSLGNVNVLALDMYDGKATADRTEASKLMQQFRQERGDMIVKGAIGYAGKNARIGTIGWCFGGGQSLLAALTAGAQAKACVIYYGMPVDDVSRLKSLHADVLGIFATREQWINPEVVQKFEANMRAAGKNLIVKNYDADHGFANPSNTIFDKEATEDAYNHTVSFFRERLK
jgi:carboxymethylenebutenolidase